MHYSVALIGVLAQGIDIRECVCVCVCVRERERERALLGTIERLILHAFSLIIITYYVLHVIYTGVVCISFIIITSYVLYITYTDVVC